MQEQSQQTLLPGLKLSYDHPHFIPLSLFPITPPQRQTAPAAFRSGSCSIFSYLNPDSPAHQFPVHGIDGYRRAGGQLAGEDGAGDERLDARLQVSAQRPRAVQRVVAAADYQLLCRVRDLELQRAIGQTLAQRLDHDVDDAAEVRLGERMEHDRLVEAVQELRPERAAQLAHDGVLRALADLAVLADAVEQVLAAEVRGEDDDGVLEIDRAPLRIGDAAVVEDLQQDVEHVRMRLLDLVEQHDAVRFAPHGLGQLAALVVADVSRRCADKTRDGELLHVLGHIDTHDVVLIVKQALGQRLCKLGLADAGGAEEQERADGAVRVGDTCAGAEDGLRDLLHGLVLADDALVEQLAEVQDLLALTLAQLCDGDARPLGDDVCYLLLGDGVVHHGVALALLGLLLRLCKLTLKRREVRVFELCGLLVLVVELGVLDVGVELFELGLEVLDLVHAVLLAVPARLHLVELILEVGQLLAQLRETVLAELVVLLLQRHLLDLQLHDLAADVVHLGGHRVDLGADEGAGLVDEVNGLVGEETVGDVAVGERSGGDERAVVDAHAVEHLVALLEAAEDGYRVLHRRLVHLHGLEAALKRGVLFDVLAVLVERGRADAVQLAAGEHRLEEVAGVHAALGLARADYRVQLVDEEDDAPLGLADLFEHGLQALLEFAAVLCARDERAHVEGEYGLVLEAVGHVAAHDALRQPLGDGGLADARLAYQDGVVLGFAGEDTHDVSDLGVAADDGVELVVTRALHKIRAVFIQRVVGALRVVAGDGRGLDLAQFGREGGLRDAVVGEDALCRGGAGGEDADHQVFDGEVLVAHGLCGLFGGGEDAAELGGHVDLAAVAADLGQRGDSAVKLRKHRVAVNAHALKQGGDEPAVLIDEGVEQMLRGDIAVAVLLRHGLCGLHRFDGFLSEILSVHNVRSFRC